MRTVIRLPCTKTLEASKLVVSRDLDGDLLVGASCDGNDQSFYVNPEAVETFIAAIRKVFPAPADSSSKPSQAYKGNGDHDWESVRNRPAEDENGATDRLRVPGGWLYCVTHNDMENPSVVFVPMPDVVKHKV